MTGPARTTLLRARGVAKAFPGVQALDGVAIDVRSGEIHALVGENGAGKSTLARLIGGLSTPDAGRMELAGEPWTPGSRGDAERSGVRMVLQELNLIGTLSVAENLFLDRLPSRSGVLRRRRLAQQAREVLERVGLAGLDPWVKAGELGVGAQQLVEIAATLARRFRLLILDEPTAALTDAESDLLFERIDALRADGVGILYISHRLEEIRRIADRVTVLRDGRAVSTERVADVTVSDMVRAMVGRDVASLQRRPRRSSEEVALSVEGLSRGTRVRDVSFEVRRGEILGFAGLVGSGRTELMRCVFGADRPDRGVVRLGPAMDPVRWRSPRDAVRAGVAFLTEDRKQQGLLLSRPVRPNLTLARLRDVATAWGRIRPGREAAVAQGLAEALSIKCHSIEQRTGELSGGNQQKVVLGRWLHRDSAILIFDEPTRGIDVGARFEIYRLLEGLADRGKAIIVVSSDLPEIMAIADRIAVMSSGRLTATFRRGEWSEETIIRAALREHLDAGGPRVESRREER